MWDYRALIVKIAVTDLRIRYKNSVLGFVWSMLQPLLLFLILFLVFSNLFTNKGIENYPLFLLLGIIVWGFFDKATSFSLQSIVGKPNLVKKIFFPREVLVISACLTAFMMMLLELVVYLVYLVGTIAMGTKVTFTWLAALLPVLLALEFVFTLGVALAISSLNVRFRDVQYIWGVLMQAGFFMTPVMYSLTILGDSWYIGLLRFNPMATIIESARGLLIYGKLPAEWDTSILIFATLLTIGAGWLIFRRIEPSFGEEV